MFQEAYTRILRCDEYIISCMQYDYDMFIIGGGINGAGIAYDASGRGLRVGLCEQDDLASGTSSKSTKLIHGGLRYLEQYAFRLVRESLGERECLLQNAPHLIWPLNFVLPHHQGLRPAWLIRCGLFIYDHLYRRRFLESSCKVNLRQNHLGQPLKDKYRLGFSYSDCWVDDARLVVANAIGARQQGADIMTRHQLINAVRKGQHWQVTVRDLNQQIDHIFTTRVLVNAAGPWLNQVLACLPQSSPPALSLIKGSHIVVPKLYEGVNAYIFQHHDGRIVFTIPYEQDFTLIGTTDVVLDEIPQTLDISTAEIDYLKQCVDEYFKQPLKTDDIVYSFAGIRPLQQDEEQDAQSLSRDYCLQLDRGHHQAPLLNVIGGKITTYRRLAEQVMQTLKDYLPPHNKAWTANKALPGGNMEDSNFIRFLAQCKRHYPWLPTHTISRLAHQYGTRINKLLKDIHSEADLGTCFGADLYQVEVDFLVHFEWAETAEDILWRRTKLGLRFSPAQITHLTEYLRQFTD